MSYELKDIAFKKRKVLRISKLRIYVGPLIYGHWKKRVLEKVVFCVKKGDVMYISSRIQRASGRNL